MVGSTPLAEQLDPETVAAVMARYFETTRVVVERWDGTVEKFIGDAVLAVFGVPELHEDDALRGLGAASEIRAEIRRLSAELEDQGGVGIDVRIGVNTGEVVVRPDSPALIGDAVNVAARLEQSAASGEILVAEETGRAAGIDLGPG